MSNVAYKAAEFADKHLGVEKPIRMETGDARYRYYQWLRSWYGMGQREATNKCPFYQFMFWGSLLLVATSPLFIWMKLLYWIVAKPIGFLFPEWIEDLDDQIAKSPMVASLLTFLGTFVGLLLISIFSKPIVLSWLGYIIHWIFAVPVFAIQLVWLGIKYVGISIAWIFTNLWGLLVATNWSGLGYVLGVGLLWLVGFGLAVVVLYYVATFLFNRGVFNIFVRKSCEVRENRIKKRNERIAKKRELRLKREMEQREYEKEHAEEIKAEKARLRKKAKEREEFWTKNIETAYKVIKPIGLSIYYVIFVPIIYFVKAILWVLRKIGDFFVIIWSLITETISNHCPPIDFVYQSEVNEGVLNLSKNNPQYYVVYDRVDERDYVIPKKLLVDYAKELTINGDKPLVHGRPVKGVFEIRTSDDENIRRERYHHYYGWWLEFRNPKLVHEIISLKRVVKRKPKLPKKSG